MEIFSKVSEKSGTFDEDHAEKSFYFLFFELRSLSSPLSSISVKPLASLPLLDMVDILVNTSHSQKNPINSFKLMVMKDHAS